MQTPLPPAGRSRPTFTGARTVLLVEDLQRASVFYEAVGFAQVDRFPAEGEPSRVGLVLQEHRLDLRVAPTPDGPPLDGPSLDGPSVPERQALVLTTDDVSAAFELLLQFGGVGVSSPRRDAEHGHVAWLTGPDGHLVQLLTDPSPVYAERVD